jgi:endonuclease/exonuclease/phosphatase (EEP) superfamily protein YafD
MRAPCYSVESRHAGHRAAPALICARRRVALIAWMTLIAVLPTLWSCFSLTADPRALVIQPDGRIRALSLACSPTPTPIRPTSAAKALDSDAVRITTWNIHKESDTGWQSDLAALAAGNDIVLLQEVTLQPAVRNILHAADLRWVMASSFEYANYDVGVLTASNVGPVANCTQRAVEPILRLPKSAIISWFALNGSTRTLAVVNVHAINFSVSLEAYRAQFAALVDALANHAGPIILAGDLNTWSAARSGVIEDVASRLSLVEIPIADDKRTLFFGKQLDHILVRGLRVVASAALAVHSSDHNPVTATLAVIP